MRMPRFTIRGMMVAVAVIASALLVGATMRRMWREMTATLNPPPDQEVRAMFAANRADFETVRDMVLADPTDGIYLFPDHPPNLKASSKQLEKCRRFMRRLGVIRIERSRQCIGDVAFQIYLFGNVADSYEKLIVFSRTPLEPIRADTDTPEFQRDNSIVFSEIGDGWYIEKVRD